MENLNPMAIDEALHLARQPIRGPQPEARHDPKGIDFHGGLIDAPVHGRTDKIPLNIPSGSYVLPADIVSAIGQGNTLAGARAVQEIMKGAPYGANGGAYGSDVEPVKRGPGAPTPHMAHGGKVDMVPIIAAGGEYVLAPHECRWLGDGDADKGHRALDKFVVETRNHLRKTLGKLRPPKRD
jgi:hypothetical protein